MAEGWVIKQLPAEHGNTSYEGIFYCRLEAGELRFMTAEGEDEIHSVFPLYGQRRISLMKSSFDHRQLMILCSLGNGDERKLERQVLNVILPSRSIRDGWYSAIKKWRQLGWMDPQRFTAERNDRTDRQLLECVIRDRRLCRAREPGQPTSQSNASIRVHRVLGMSHLAQEKAARQHRLHSIPLLNEKKSPFPHPFHSTVLAAAPLEPVP